MRNSGWLKILSFAVYAMAFFSLGIYVHSSLTKPSPPISSQQVSTAAELPASTRGGQLPDNPFVQVAEQVTPSVVNISTVTTGKGTPIESSSFWQEEYRV